MLKPIADLGPDVIAFEAIGVVSAEDYAQQLVPALDRLLDEGVRARMLYVLGPAFERFELGAMVADAKLGFSHLGDFERIAVVSGHDWVHQSMRAFGMLLPCPVRCFDDDELEAAKAWVAEQPRDVLELSIARTGSVAHIHARVSGKLDRDAEQRLVQTVGDGIGDADELRLLIEAVDFHGWRDLRSLWQHLRFVAGLRRKLERVAIVGEARWQRRLVATARQVLHVDARFYEAERLAEAQAWLG